MISAFEGLFATAAEAMSVDFGPVTATCDPFPFDFTDYYSREMGEGLLRSYAVFGAAEGDLSLAWMKSVTCARERELLYPGTDRRRINLDPGILTADHLLLASHKRAGHRIRVAKDVYGELELLYMKGAFQPLPWTYPDYRTRRARAFFEGARRALEGETGS